MRIDEAADSTAVFDFYKYFNGHTRASGWFADRFGKPRRHFCGDFFGSFDKEHFRLEEKLFYTDGVKEERIWHIAITDKGIFTAQSDSLIGPAHGLLSGNTLTMRYCMRVAIEQGKHWQLDMKDSMILQPDGSLHNITLVYKWGVRIGAVSTQYKKHDGNSMCFAVE